MPCSYSASGTRKPVPGPCPVLVAVGIAIGGWLFAGSAVASGVYKWVDEQGKVHYGDRPPGTVEPAEVEIGRAPAPSTDDADRREKTRRLLDAIESEREQEKKEAARTEARSAQRKRNCALAKRRMEILERGNTISVTGEDGERQYLDDDQRALALSQAKELVREWC